MHWAEVEIGQHVSWRSPCTYKMYSLKFTFKIVFLHCVMTQPPFQLAGQTPALLSVLFVLLCRLKKNDDTDALRRIYASPWCCWFMYLFGCLVWTFEHSITNCLTIKVMHSNKSRLMKMRNIFLLQRLYAEFPLIPLLWWFNRIMK